MPNSRHHARLLIGTTKEAESYLNLYCKDLGIRLANNPDFFAFKTDTFGIDEARELKLLAARKAVTQQKTFFISPVRITLEAQNALLKTFEDPSPDTIFFLVTREEALIIPTLLSRMQMTRLNLVQTGQEAQQFLSSSLKDRLTFARKFADEEGSLPDFLDNLLTLLRKQEGSTGLIEKVYNLRRLINDSNLMPRLVIEHLSLVL
ncbi:MAG: hypothetical protein A3G05_01005 [Candidatus Zambryskibacteria bacterium RIFCSPLOWO2_12_FULL_45_14]|uniref:DNA polymerase III subunit delta n=2 Tax=Candidatus Zambryskiibacteriota TaxID=1817925 RepID=A0A1G2UMS9_9BACT|nr:MAG: hypothetical protein A3H60_00830 [Candidatus Zambryskibacteria bacterium RIFCSPLOWO2_02_FULL_44_12b]OHB13643.1 MAG: hypothetical protein A3G05_01005 [Candidatus Zambryskibacteria bacterium RIFCSPLOWO2_12_FULL_45_14]